jgi:hypothetical protein
MTIFRIAFPGAIAVGGVIVMIASGGGGVLALGAVLVGAAAAVAFADLLMRLGISSETDRQREEQARRRYDRTGSW